MKQRGEYHSKVQYVPKGSQPTEETNEQPPEPERKPKQEKSRYREKQEKHQDDTVQEGKPPKEQKQDEKHHNEKQREPKRDKPKQQKEKKQYPKSKYDYDPNKITAETVIPDLPKKGDVLQKPSKEQYYKQLDEIEDKIKLMKDKKYKTLDELRKSLRAQSDTKESIPQRELLKVKKEERKELQVQFDKLKSQFDDYKYQIADLQDEKNDLQSKMKTQDRPDAMIQKLKSLKDRQANDKLTPQEEKNLCKQIADLERSMPFAQPVEELEKQIHRLNIEKNKVGDIMHQANLKVKQVITEIKKIQEELDNLFENKEESKKQIDPKIEAEKKKFDDQIDELWAKKRKIEDDYDAAWDKYEEQQDFIEYVEWMQRKKQKLLKDLDYKKRQEEKKTREEARAKRFAQMDEKERKLEEEEKNKPKSNPFYEELDLCNQLIVYCQKLKPVQKQQQNVQKKPEDVDQKLQSDEYKKEKLTVVKKKDEKEDLYNVSQKKKLNVKAKAFVVGEEEKKKEVDPEKQILNHNPETIRFFESVKVATPFYLADLDKVIKNLEERKSYYENPPEEDIEKHKESKVQGEKHGHSHKKDV